MTARRRQPDPLTRRERQIMDVLYAQGRATAREIEAALPDAPTGATVRTILKVLLTKGLVRHHQEGRAFVYRPVTSPATAAKSAVRRLVDVFFQGSLERAVTGLLDARNAVSAEELERLEALIREARQKSTKP